MGMKKYDRAADGLPWSRKSNVESLNINTDVLYETCFPLRRFQEMKARLLREGTSPYLPLIRDIRSYYMLQRMYLGLRISPVTGKPVKLEVSFNERGSLVSSLEAIRRWIERLNGVE